MGRPVVNPRPPSNKLKSAIAALLSGEARTQRDAALIAGMHETTLSAALGRQGTKDYIISVVRDRLSSIGAIAAARVTEALIETAESDYVKADMARFVLGISGIRPERDAPSALSGGINLTVVMNGERVSISGPQPIDVTPQSPESTD